MNDVKETKGGSLEARLEDISNKLTEVKKQIKQVEQTMVQNQRQLQGEKDRLMSIGLELQGQEKLLKDLLGVEDKAPVKLEEAKNGEEPK